MPGAEEVDQVAPRPAPRVENRRVGGDAAAASMMPNDDAMQKMMASFPIGRLAGFEGLPVTLEQIEQLLAVSNAGATED